MTEPHAPDFSDDNKRRGFIVKIAAIIVGGVTSIIPAIFAGGFFLTPLLKKKEDSAETDGFVRVGSSASLVPGGPPLAFKIRGIKKDAWTTYAEADIGSVYVKMDAEGVLTAFNATCTHLGCTVNFKAEENSFACPCHDSAFAFDGTRTNEIPPRHMDALDVELRNEDELWVKYESYRAGTSEKIPV